MLKGLRVIACLWAAINGWPALAADRIPGCRLDGTTKVMIESALRRALSAYSAAGRKLDIDDVAVNPATPPATIGTLAVYVVTDVSEGEADPKGCSKGLARKGAQLDNVSVRGGCYARADGKPEIRCSADAVRLFGDTGKRDGRANPALLYVMAHELGHLYQRRSGEYAGRVERIQLGSDRASKLNTLREACRPAMTQREEEADRYALEVLRRLLPLAPYREPTFSERGSLFWNIDLLALAADGWQQLSAEREFVSQTKVHAAFVPTEFPTPKKTIEANARQFVCDVLTKSKGEIAYPAMSSSHPPIEQRLRRIAEELKPVAQSLPESGGSRDFAPVARLQQDLGPIFTHIYRETGVYLEGVQAAVCTLVNASEPAAACR